nr:amidohydrolase [Microbacterium sp. EST19A]
MAIDADALYKQLHAHPELSFAEHETAALLAGLLGELGYEVITGIAGTGLVGILRNGDGGTVLLRADMDGLPVREETGLPWASVDTAVDHNGDRVPVMHACGHDIHMTCLIAAAEELADTRNEWSGTVIALFQPAEERGGGAAAMVADGLFTRIPHPDIVLGQHVFQRPAGVVGAHSGAAFSAIDTMEVTMHGRGGHGSRPETTIDPVLMAASTVVRLQGVVSREVAAQNAAVVTVGHLNAGTKNNIIPDDARLGVSVRSFDAAVRTRVLDAVERIIRAEAVASGSPALPDIVYGEQYPLTYNDPESTARVMQAFEAEFGDERVSDPTQHIGSEDVGALAIAAGVPLVYWILGGGDPDAIAEARATGTFAERIPSNHSPRFAPLPQPTISAGTRALVVAARIWLV